MDLIDEILKRAATQEGSVTEILRLAQIAASKLEASEIEAWISQELAGYKSIDDLPDYRRLRGELQAFNPYRGWVPVLFKNPRSNEAVSEAPAFQSIGSIEEIYASNKSNGIIAHIPPIKKKILIESLSIKTDVQLRLQASQLYGIIDAVRSKVFIWAVELSKAGVSGDNLKFSKEEVQAAAPVIQNFHIGDQANIGSIGFAGRDLTGTNASILDLDAVKLLLSQILENSGEITGPEGREICRLAHETRDGIETGTLALGEVRLNLVRIREFAENVVGNLIAGGIVLGISSIIG